MDTPYIRKFLHSSGKSLLVPGGESRTFAIGFPLVASIHKLVVRQVRPTTAVPAGGGTAAAVKVTVYDAPYGAASVPESHARISDLTDDTELEAAGLPAPFPGNGVDKEFPTDWTNENVEFYTVVGETSGAAGAAAIATGLDIQHSSIYPYLFVTIAPTAAASDTLWELLILASVEGH